MLLVIKGFIFMLLVFCIQNFLNTQNSWFWIFDSKSRI
jgi:hypothetical protein